MEPLIVDHERSIGLQPDPGAYGSPIEAFVAFLDDEEVEHLRTHHDGWLVLHEERCTWGQSAHADCRCCPRLIRVETRVH